MTRWHNYWRVCFVGDQADNRACDVDCPASWLV